MQDASITAIFQKDSSTGSSLPPRDQDTQQAYPHGPPFLETESSSPSWSQPDSPQDGPTPTSEKQVFNQEHPIIQSTVASKTVSSSRARGHLRKSKIKMSFRKLKQFSPSLTLENNGSTARDHLASERTFLAYVRTSLAVAGTGVALVQLFAIADITSQTNTGPVSAANGQLHRFAKPLGVSSVVVALIILSSGMYRYFLIQNALPEGKFPTARVSIAFTSFALYAIIVVVFGVLLSSRK